MNIPYVKQYDKNGIVVNPIRRNYISTDSNRRTRRLNLQKEKYAGKRIQVIKLKDEKGVFTGHKKIIKHVN